MRANHDALRHIELPLMPTTDEWVVVSEAARRIGISPQAVRLRLLRGHIDGKRDNKGRQLVYAPEPTTKPQPTPRPTALAPAAPLPSADILTVLQAQIDALRADHAAQIAALRADHAAEIVRLAAVYEARASRAENLAAGALESAAAASERIAAQLIQAAEKPAWRRFLGL